MSRRIFAIVLAVGCLIPFSARPAPAQDISANVQIGGGPVGIDFFYDSLAPYGDWVNRPDYGWVWAPANVDPGWRPYTVGHWVDTDDYGWMWVSDEPWGWATCHYGRWYYDDDYGWSWVPGETWGPAWVAWRQGEDVIGWAPLPPEVRVGVLGGAFNINIGVDVVDRLRPHEWCFVRDRDFLAPRLDTDLYRPSENVTIIKRTTNITNYRVENNRVINRSVNSNRIERAVGHPVRRVRVETSASPREHGGRPDSGVVRVFQPRVEHREGTARPAPPPQVVEKSRQTADRIRQRHATEVQTLKSQGVQVQPRGAAAPTRTGAQPGAETRRPEATTPGATRPGAPGIERTGPGVTRTAPGVTRPGAPGTERSVPGATRPGSERTMPGAERSVPAPSRPGTERSLPGAERSVPAPSRPGSERSVPVPGAERPVPGATRPGSERTTPRPEGMTPRESRPAPRMQPQPRPESRPEPRMQSQPESRPQPRPESRPEPRMQPQPESRPSGPPERGKAGDQHNR